MPSFGGSPAFLRAELLSASAGKLLLSVSLFGAIGLFLKADFSRPHGGLAGGVATGGCCKACNASVRPRPRIYRSSRPNCFTSTVGAGGT
ncbi:hypothetical protein COCNU_11G007390 [Cocos nucifera]|uniref:Uncharacterized protein n=1 Tax=Cocos nucifera TaxID=13894 RepID=A0A8K0IP92_COCNU|nr:hypothetical protein COCNU_11G007390 [Cocos nucifera]